MAKQPKAHKMNAGDILSSEAAPAASTVTGQFIRLKDDIAIDPCAEVHMVAAGETRKLAPGTSLCVFTGGFKGEVSTIKLHATQEITLTGPLVWSRMENVDLKETLMEACGKTDKITSLAPIEIISLVVAVAFLYQAAAFPTTLLHVFISEAASSELVKFIVLAVAFVGLGVAALFGIDYLLRTVRSGTRYDIERCFTDYLMVSPPNIDGLKAT